MTEPGASKMIVPSPPGVLYPDNYTWLVFMSAVDLMLTWVILELGGYEANALAAHVIEQYDLVGIAAYKFGLTVIVILITEFVGRRKYELGRTLAAYSVAFPATGALTGAILLLRINV